MQAMTLGQKIAKLRKAKGMTQSALAEKLNVSPQAVSKWETDQTYPDVGILYTLAQELDTSVDYLLNGVDQEPETIFVPESTSRNLQDLVLKIKVISDSNKVNVNIPYILAKKMLQSDNNDTEDYNSFFQISTDEINISPEYVDSIFNMIDNGVLGKLLDIETSDGSQVQIYVE